MEENPYLKETGGRCGLQSRETGPIQGPGLLPVAKPLHEQVWIQDKGGGGGEVWEPVPPRGGSESPRAVRDNVL